MNMNKMIPFLLLAGLTCIVIVGLWVVETYDYTFSGYSEEVYFYLMIGVGLVFLAFFLTQFTSKQVTQGEKDNRVFIHEIWSNKKKLGDKTVKYSLITLLIIAIFNLELALRLFIPMLSIVFIIIGFFYIMHEDGEDVEWGKLNSRFVKRFLKLFDYRKHPFSISLILFILIIVTLLLSKQYGFHIELDGQNTHGRHSTSLRIEIYFFPIVIYLCGFLYIIQNSDFLGIRQAKQSTTKLFIIYIVEWFVCVVALFLLAIELLG